MPAMDDFRFLSAWLRHPLQIGACLPSSGRLAMAMANQVPPTARTVVELGPGTGIFTGALLDGGVQADGLILVEREPEFVRLLRKRYPGCTVVEGDAGDLPAVLTALSIDRVDAVVSGLPLLSLGPKKCEDIVEGVKRSCLAHGGNMVQFTYGLVSPIAQGLMRRHGLTGQRVDRILWNLPPAAVWRYQEASATTH